MSGAKARRLALMCPLSPPLFSGAAAAAFRIGSGLVARGWEVTVLACRTPGQAERETIDGCEVRRLPGGRLDPGQRLSALAKLRFSLSSARHVRQARQHYDAVLYFGAGRVALPSILACRRLRLPVVIRPTHLADDSPSALRRRPFGRAVADTLARAQGFVAISPRLQQSIDADPAWSRRPCALIPNAVDTARFTPASDEERAALRRRLGWTREERVVIFVGVLSPEKGVGDLLDAWERLDAEPRTNTRLVLAGGDLGRASNVELALRATRIDGVQVAGQLHPEEVLDRLRAADHFVFPTRGEGLPNALLEAMACGLPCVASRLEGINDYLIEEGERGRLFPIGDAAALTRALEATLSDGEAAREQGRRARAWIEENASLAKVAGAYDAFLTSVIEEGGS